MNTSESSVEVEVIESHDALGSSKHNFPKREQNYQCQHQSRRGNISDDKNDDQNQTSNQSESEKKPATNFSTSNKGPLTEDSRIRAMPIAKEGNINTVVEEKNPPAKTMCKTEFPMNDDNDKNQKDSLIHHSIRFRGGKNNQELENETAKPAHNFHRSSSVTTSSNYHWESGDVTCGVENSCNNFVSTELSSCLSISNKNEKKELPHEVIIIDDDSLDEDPGERIPSADEASTNSKLQIPTSVGWSKEKKIVDGVVQVNKKVFQQIRQKGTMPASVPEGGKKDASAFVDPTLTLLGAFKSISDNTSQCALASDADDTHASLKRKWQEFGKLSAISERKTRKLEVSCLNPLSGRGDTFGLSQLENQTLLASVGACRTNSSTSSLSASLASTTTCTLQDVRPSFSQTTITFLNQRAGINTVDELCNANDSTLCVCLMAFNGFKLACAMEAWRSKQRFRNLYRLRLAKKTILKWKRIAEAFMASLDKKPIRVANENEHGVSDNAWDSSSAEDEVGHDKSMQRNTQKIPNDRLSIEGSLRSILSSHETAILEQHFGIYTASQLVEADKPNFISRLSVVMRNNGFEDRPRREVQCLCEGMLHSWLWRATEVANQHESEKSTISESSSSSYKEPVCNLPDHLPTSCSEDIQCSFATPMSFVDLLFVRSQNMSSDEQLISLDVENLDLAQRYTHFLRKKHKIVPIEEAKAAMKSWRDDACRVLEGSNVANLTETFQTTRLDLNAICSGPGRQKVMDNVFHICKTVVDETNDGFPVRTIVTYDFSNNVLYEFEVRIRDSQCGPGAGKGAFLTYKGAKVLQKSSYWKRKDLDKFPPLPQTRRPLAASFSDGRGATVSLKGESLHGDERIYGPDNNDRVGLWREFSLANDFDDAADNISFSSNHVGCGIIELDRYAPLLPEDRKTTNVFSIKDFIFSFEPSSWRFDVKEQLNGCPQVVDFTDDMTGAPHEVARSNICMYVNEVGHNMRLVENVCSLESPRSVSYYIYVDKPMEKGQTVELLVNYKDGYESMRERRGYGKANIFNDVPSDDDAYTRIQRNLKERILLEESIFSYCEGEVEPVIDFLNTRVWDGIVAATSCFSSSGGTFNESNLLRQCIARRRIHWISDLLQRHYHGVGRKGGIPSPLSKSSVGEEQLDSNYKKGMWLFVNNWAEPGDVRPPYTGIATVSSIYKDKFNRTCFKVSIPGGKIIRCVPEAVVTFPTEEDFTDAPRRLYSDWLKWKKRDPQVKERMMGYLEKMKWDPLFSWNHWNTSPPKQNNAESACFPAKPDHTHQRESAKVAHPELKSKMLASLQWEVSEELIFLLVKEKRLLNPFDEQYWCPISVQLLKKSLHIVADYLIQEKNHCDESNLNILLSLRKKLFDVALEATRAVKAITDLIADSKTDTSSFASYLSFLEKADPSKDIKHHSRYLVVDSVHLSRVSVEDFAKAPQSLDKNWYLISEVIFVTHALASLINWNPYQSTEKTIYSLDEICNAVEINEDASYKLLTPKIRAWGPLITIPIS